MIKKRRAATVAFAAAMTVVLAGCVGGGSSEPNESADLSGTEINYWLWKDDATSTVYDDLAAEFESETGIKVNINDDITSPDFFDALTNAVAANNAPDATALNTNMFGQLIAANVLADLNDQIDAWDAKDDITDTLWQYVETADGATTYAVPHKYVMFYLYYRKDLLEAAGVEVPKTQEEFVAAAEKLASIAPDQYAFNLRGGANGQDQWAAFVAAGGAQFVNDEGEVVFDSDASRESNQRYIDTFEYAPPGSINTNSGTAIVQELEAGTIAMAIHHIGSARTLTLGEDQIGVAPIPGATEDPSDTKYMGAMTMNAVLESSQKKEAAFTWITFLSEKKAQAEIAPTTEGYIPVVTSVAEDPELNENPYFALSVELAKNGTATWPPIPGTTIVVQQVFQPIFQKALLGQAEPEDVVIQVDEALKQ